MRPYKKTKTSHSHNDVDENQEGADEGNSVSSLLVGDSGPSSAHQSPPPVAVPDEEPSSLKRAFILADEDGDEEGTNRGKERDQEPEQEQPEQDGDRDQEQEQENYLADDASDSSSLDDNDEIGLNGAQNEILNELENCLAEERDNEDQGPKVSLEKYTSNFLRSELFSKGPMKFLEKYVFDDDGTSEYKVTDILCAFGFPLPLRLVEKYDQEEFKTFLPVAIKHFASSRKRLSYPHTIGEFSEAINRANKILVLTGAGISTSLGIPDFRSSTGLYAQLADCGLSDPQEVFDIQIFREDPSIFYRIAKEVLPGSKDLYTPTHAFIKMLYDKGKLLRNYTQNIDNLEANAGVPAEKIVQCHGSFASATCQTCGYKTDGASIFDNIRAQTVPMCPICAKTSAKINEFDDGDNARGVLKPDITFFGEALPSRFDELLFGPDNDAAQCDLVICIGTSLKVAPVSEIIRVVDRDTPQVYINKTPINHNEFDITFLGKCDDVIEWMTDELGWNFSHKMNKRLNNKEPKHSINTFPGGDIEYQENQATYRFNYRGDSSTGDSAATPTS